MNHIEVDPAMFDGDGSDYASTGYDTSTQSLTSSVNAFVFENGRRYHSYYGVDKNFHPTDQTEQDRLDLHHEILIKLLGGELHKAPLPENLHRILDVGTGTGIWAIDMADRYPSAEVIGTDLSPIQPRWVPPNCRFEVDDAELEWMYTPDSFDFVHARNLSQSISDWPKLLADMYRCVKPGGFVQLGELGSDLRSDDGTLKNDNALKKAFDLIDKAMKMIGRPFPEHGTQKQQLEEAGFVDVKEYTFKQVLGPWPKDKALKQLGAMCLLMSETGIATYTLACYTRVLKMDTSEAQEIIDSALKAMKDKSTHSYNIFHVAVGRKPE